MESSSIKAATSDDDDALAALLSSITIAISRYGILALVILGTISNTLNVVVFCHKKVRASPCTLYFCTGACIDLILTLAIALPRMLTTYNLDYSAIVGVLCKLRHFTYFTLSSLSVWMVTLAAVDRFLVSSPLAARRQMSSFRSAYRLIVASACLLALIYGDLFYCADVVSNGVITSCSASTSKLCGFYNQIARLLTVLCVPETVIIIASIGITRNLKFLKQAKATTSRDHFRHYRIQKIDKELIKLVVCQIVMLTISWVPLGIQRVYALITYDEPRGALRKTIEALSDEMTSMISRMGNSLSFYVYLFTGGVLFRHTLRKCLRRILNRGRVAAGGTFRATRMTVNTTAPVRLGVNRHNPFPEQ